MHSDEDYSFAFSSCQQPQISASVFNPAPWSGSLLLGSLPFQPVHRLMRWWENTPTTLPPLLDHPTGHLLRSRTINEAVCHRVRSPSLRWNVRSTPTISLKYVHSLPSHSCAIGAADVSLLFCRQRLHRNRFLLKDGDCSLDTLTYTIKNNGVVVSYPTDGSCKLNTVQIPGIDGVYEAIQFHIHSSSEHTVDGLFFGAELHIVHTLQGGDRYAVVGILLNPGLNVDNPEFSSVLDGWKKARADTYAACGITGRDELGQGNLTVGTSHINAYDLLSSSATFYQYSGSLTTPPCSEIVDWNFSPENNLISVNQYKELIELEYSAINPETCEEFTIHNAYGSTSRPTQPLNGRPVRHICPARFKGVSSDEAGNDKGLKGKKDDKGGKKGSKGGKNGEEKSDGKVTKKGKNGDKHEKMEKEETESRKGRRLRD
jgi:carbonic anhydrase